MADVNDNNKKANVNKLVGVHGYYIDESTFIAEGEILTPSSKGTVSVNALFCADDKTLTIGVIDLGDDSCSDEALGQMEKNSPIVPYIAGIVEIEEVLNYQKSTNFTYANIIFKKFIDKANELAK